MKTETILGLTTLEPYGLDMPSHDSSATLIDKKEIVGAVSEERFTRNKHHASFPWMSMNYLLSLGYSYTDIDAVAIPWPIKQNIPKHMQIAKRFYHGLFPGLKARLHATKPFLPFEKKKIIGIGHQRAHAASAYRTSGFKKALVVSLDLGGSEEDIIETGGAIFIGDNSELTRLRAFTSSFGLFYAFVTEGLGFNVVEGEGKTMGLAPFGDSHNKAYEFLGDFCPIVKGSELVASKKSIRFGNTVMNNFQRIIFYDLHLMHKLVKRFSERDVAAAAQRILEERVVELIDNALAETGMDKLCLAGGVFLNVKLNKKLRELKRVKEIYIYPNPGDPGAAVGAALEAYYQLTGEKTINKVENNIYIGPDFTDDEIEAVLKKRHVKYKKISDPAGHAAELISRGKIVGWFQGRMEWGPRSLGARSILSAPHDMKAKDKLNLQLKEREGFVPFAPSMLLSEAHVYLKNSSESPYMIMAYDVVPHTKDDIAAAMHVDGTVRPQTVTKQQNPLYYDLIKEYDKMTGTPVVLNTSFKVHGAPIVCTPEDAVQHLFMNCVEDLVIGNFAVKLK